LDDGQPVFNERGGLLTKCGLWVEKKNLYNTGDIEITCKKCSKSLGKIYSSVMVTAVHFLNFFTQFGKSELTPATINRQYNIGG